MVDFRLSWVYKGTMQSTWRDEMNTQEPRIVIRYGARLGEWYVSWVVGEGMPHQSKNIGVFTIKDDAVAYAKKFNVSIKVLMY